MAITVHGRYYVANSIDHRTWIITRGRFELGRFKGSQEEVQLEIHKWDETVQDDTMAKPNGVQFP